MCVVFFCGHIGGHSVIRWCEECSHMYNDALSAVHLNTQVNQGIGGGIAVWEVPTISYPPTPNPSVQCNVRKNMKWIPFISLINRIPRSSQLIQGYSHLRHCEKTSFNSRFTSCTMYSPCKYLKCHVLLLSKVHCCSVKSNLPPFSLIKATPPSHSGDLPPTFHVKGTHYLRNIVPTHFSCPSPTILSGGHAALFDWLRVCFPTMRILVSGSCYFHYKL